MSTLGISTSAIRWLRRPLGKAHPGKQLLHEFSRVLELMPEAAANENHSHTAAPSWYVIAALNDSVSRELLRHAGFDRILPASLRRSDILVDPASDIHDWYVSPDTCLLSLPCIERDTERSQRSRSLLRFLPALQRRATLGGLIITVPADSLRDAAPENLQNLRNVIKQLQLDFAQLCSPALAVHLLVTGCEIIEGFCEFFGAESHNAEDERLIGITSDFHNSSGTLQGKFDALCQQIHLHTPQRLQTEQNVQARRRLAGFAWQFERMQSTLATLGTEFAAARHIDTGMTLRGIYFTCSTSGHGFFARAFFNALLSLEQSRVRAPSTRLPAAFFRRHAFTLLLLPLLVSLLTWGHAYYSLHEKILTARKILAHEMLTPRNDVDLQSSIQHLVRVQQARALFSPGLSPWLTSIGMYDTTPIRRLDSTYTQLLIEQWLPVLLTHTLQWSDDDTRQYGERFDSIKACLMLLQPARRDAKFLHRWVNTSHAFDAVDPNNRRQMSRLLDDYLTQDLAPQPLERHRVAIKAQQSRLRALTPDEQIYSTWLSAGRQKTFDFTPQLGTNAPGALHGVTSDNLVLPTIFTAEFFSKIDFPALVTNFLSTEQESWVLGQRESINADAARSIVENLQQRYLRDYAQAWHDLYEKLSLRQPRNSAELVQLLQILSADDTSPLSRLFVVTRENTPSATEFSRYFQVVPVSLQHRLARAIGALHDAYVDESESVHDDSSAAQAKIALHELDGIVRELPEPVANWLATLRGRYAQQQQANQAHALRNLWRTQVYTPCTTLLQGKYPFVSTADTDVNYADFVAYFRPDGIEDSFVKQHLASYRGDFGHTSTPTQHISKNALTMLQQGQHIRAAFFTHDKEKAAFELRITPRVMDAHLSSYTLQDSAVSLAYSHGPRLEKRMLWPDTLDSLQSTFVTLDGKRRQREFSGSWALFRWLDGARLSPGVNRSDFDAIVSDGAHNIKLQMTTTPRISPLDRKLLAHYQCIADL